MLELITLDDLILFENLECILLLVVLLDDEQHFAIGTFADDRLGDEVFGGDFASLVLLLGDDLFKVFDFILCSLCLKNIMSILEYLQSSSGQLPFL